MLTHRWAQPPPPALHSSTSVGKGCQAGATPRALPWGTSLTCPTAVSLPPSRAVAASRPDTAPSVLARWLAYCCVCVGGGCHSLRRVPGPRGVSGSWKGCHAAKRRGALGLRGEQGLCWGRDSGCLTGHGSRQRTGGAHLLHRPRGARGSSASRGSRRSVAWRGPARGCGGRRSCRWFWGQWGEEQLRGAPPSRGGLTRCRRGSWGQVRLPPDACRRPHPQAPAFLVTTVSPSGQGHLLGPQSCSSPGTAVRGPAQPCPALCCGAERDSAAGSRLCRAQGGGSPGVPEVSAEPAGLPDLLRVLPVSLWPNCLAGASEPGP